MGSAPGILGLAQIRLEIADFRPDPLKVVGVLVAQPSETRTEGPLVLGVRTVWERTVHTPKQPKSQQERVRQEELRTAVALGAASPGPGVAHDEQVRQNEGKIKRSRMFR